MKGRILLVTAAAIGVAFFSISSLAGWWTFSNDDEVEQSSEKLTEVAWPDLIPADFEQPENPYQTMTQETIDRLMDGSEESQAEIARIEKEFNYAPVVPELDGMRVKIPAYITPLEFDGQSKLNEFLLVPYVGACMHTPPPPANQIVHAQSQKSIESPGMYEAVWAIGTIKTETVKSSLAESGYRMEVEKIVPYTE